MDPRHLVQLATILEKGSITQASKHLHLTQPTLTHNMQTLEMQAGGTLFERSRHGVRSTPLGEMFAREGRAISRRLQEVAEVTARHRHGIHRQLRIGTGPLVGAALLGDVVRETLLRCPELALSVQSDRPHLLVEQLIDGRHDLVIAPSWLERPPPGIERLPLIDDVLGVFCGATHPLAAQGALKNADDLRWISLGSTSPFDQEVREMLRSVGVPRARVDLAVMGEAFMLLDILSQGQHLAVLSRFALRQLAPRFALVEMATPGAAKPRPIYVWCRSEALEDRATAQVTAVVQEVAARQLARIHPALGQAVHHRAAPAKGSDGAGLNGENA